MPNLNRDADPTKPVDPGMGGFGIPLSWFGIGGGESAAAATGASTAMNPLIWGALISAAGNIGSSAFQGDPFQRRTSFSGTGADPVKSQVETRNVIRGLLAALQEQSPIDLSGSSAPSIPDPSGRVAPLNGPARKPLSQPLQVLPGNGAPGGPRMPAPQPSSASASGNPALNLLKMSLQAGRPQPQSAGAF